jgi:predicted phosphate transport protein (TIGR00153 family)
MNIDKFLKLLVPKDHSFFPLFINDSKNLVQASEQLKLLMATADCDKQGQIIRRIKELEKIGDSITDNTYFQLNKTFITPFDREDIHELASNIDNVLDSINGISRRIKLYSPLNLLPVYSEMAEIIYRAAKEIDICINYLEDISRNKKEILKACDNITGHEEMADEVYYKGISGMLQNEKDVIELMKSKEILENLEKCVDETDDVMETIKTIIIKIS